MGKQKRKSATAAGPSQATKRWHPDFSMNRRKDRKVGDRPFTEALEEMEMERSLLDAFLLDSKVSGPAWKAKKVRKFFRETARAPAAKLWVDHRLKNSCNVAARPTWLASSNLAEHLEKQVSDLSATICIHLTLLGVQIWIMSGYHATLDVGVFLLSE